MFSCLCVQTFLDLTSVDSNRQLEIRNIIRDAKEALEDAELKDYIKGGKRVKFRAGSTSPIDEFKTNLKRQFLVAEVIMSLNVDHGIDNNVTSLISQCQKEGPACLELLASKLIDSPISVPNDGKKSFLPFVSDSQCIN